MDSKEGVKCHLCGGRLELLQRETYRCIDCTAIYLVVSGKIVNSYIAPIKYSKSIALDTLLMWLSKYIGIPSSTYFESEITWSRLVLIPYYNIVARIHGEYRCWIREAIYRGRVYSLLSFAGGEMYRDIDFTSIEKRGELDRIVNISRPIYQRPREMDRDTVHLMDKIDEDIRNMEIPFENKSIYKWGDISEYNPLQFEATPPSEKIENYINSQIHRNISKYLGRVCTRMIELDINIDVIEAYPIYIPIWIFKYKVGKGREYYGAVEASTGRVIYATYPVKKATRLGYASMGILHMLLAALPILTGDPILGTVSIPLIGYSMVYLYRTLTMGKAEEA